MHPMTIERLGKAKHILIGDQFVFTTAPTDQLKEDQIALNMAQRRWASLADNTVVTVRRYSPQFMLESVVFVADFFGSPRAATVDGAQLLDLIRPLWDRQCVTDGQVCFFPTHYP